MCVCVCALFDDYLGLFVWEVGLLDPAQASQQASRHGAGWRRAQHIFSGSQTFPDRHAAAINSHKATRQHEAP